jgi:hypothetical protein
MGIDCLTEIVRLKELDFFSVGKIRFYRAEIVLSGRTIIIVRSPLQRQLRRV